jgi:hypothetical protein
VLVVIACSGREGVDVSLGVLVAVAVGVLVLVGVGVISDPSNNKTIFLESLKPNTISDGSF